MTLDKVILDADVYSMCLQHALTTETEEVMGILIGHIDEVYDNSVISAMYILSRADKQPDRVEISAEQLVSASTYAENLTKELNSPRRVIGWYHSHPHITVLPSHVDVRTQSMYQSMDPYFVGLIFSVFPQVAGAQGNTVELTAFQARGNPPDLEHISIPIEIMNSERKLHNLEALTTLPKILIQEEIETRETLAKNSVDDEVTTLHNDACNTISRLNIIQKVTIPLQDNLKERKMAIKERIEYMKRLKMQLLQARTCDAMQNNSFEEKCKFVTKRGV